MQEMKRAKLEDLISDLGIPERVSTKKDVAIYGEKPSILRIPKRVYVNGYVKSESREGYFHSVSITYFPGIKSAKLGECSCESFSYRGFPCKHTVKLKDAYLAWLKIR